MKGTHQSKGSARRKKSNAALIQSGVVILYTQCIHLLEYHEWNLIVVWECELKNGNTRINTIKFVCFLLYQTHACVMIIVLEVKLCPILVRGRFGE